MKKHSFSNVWSAARLQGKSLWMKESLRQCIRPVCGGFYSPGHDEIRRVPVLQNPSAVLEPFEKSGFRYAVVTVLSSLLVRCRPRWENLILIVKLAYAATDS